MLGNYNDAKQKEAIANLQEALESGETETAQKAWAQFHASLVEAVKEDYATYDGDMQALIQRGYRQLTSAEKKFYEKMIEAGKSANPKQAWTDLLATDKDFMPTTIIEDVYKDLIEEHPLLAKINFQNVAYLTKWILNDHTGQNAVWGQITSQITQEITSSFQEIDLNLCKLSAYVIIAEDMLDLGPTYLDNYIRTILKESVAVALETGIVTGNGLNQPAGLDRNIAKAANFSQSTGYEQKTAVTVTNFLPEAYGSVVAQLAVTEVWYTQDSTGNPVAESTALDANGALQTGYTKHGGKMRSFDKVTLACNMVDYLTKVMPATTVLNTAGAYVANLFPFPTDVVRSNAIETGKAILFLPEEYFMGIGGTKDGTIEYSDEYKFLEDQRVYKIKLHGNGRAFDNTVAVLLDISDLDPAYITVLAKEETA